MKKITCYIIALVAAMFTSCGPAQLQEAKFESIFNGTDFSGWETYIGVPDPSVEVPGMTLTNGVYTEAVGVNKDPLQVFSIQQVDGEPVLHATGQIYGSFSTIKEYENYHFRVEVKWGDKKWAPREDKLRNAGLLYHGVGEFGKGLEVWKISHECQIMETMFGDSYRMGDTYCDITASRTAENEKYTFDPTAAKVSFGAELPAGPICSRNPMNEKPMGEWNVVEVICSGDTSVHIINGKVNMINTNSHLMVDGRKVPLTKGVIQLQSEGAEIFYRRMELRPVTRIPAAYLK